MTGIEHLLHQRLVVCVGSGGVGKTTTAAAIALAGALAQRHTAVITVDPAHRLKDALGLTDLSAHPQRVPLADENVRFDALALDTKRTFDSLIERVASSPEMAQRIFANRIYQEVSSGLGGSTEYMAMERLHELLGLRTYNLIVVDTPPSAHARDLLSAPLRMTDLLASRAVHFLKTPASVLDSGSSRLARLTLRTLLGTLQRWTGVNLLGDLADFAANFEHLVEGFRSRAQDIDLDLRRRSTSFVLVTTPEPDTIDAVIALHQELTRERFPVAGVIANRVHAFPPVDEAGATTFPEPLRHKLLTNYADFATLTRRDQHGLERLRRETGSPILATLPVLIEPPASLVGLTRFAALLSDTGPRRRDRPPRSRP